MEKLRSYDSATKDLLFECDGTDPHLIDTIVHTSRQAFERWSSLPVDKRIAILKNFAKILKEKQDFFAHILSQENGKLLGDARGEVSAMVAKVDISIDAYKDRCKELSNTLGHTQSITRFKPQGVVAVFGPFNFPGHLPNGHIVPALLAGNSVLFKPSELTPFTGQKLVELYHEAGIPRECVQIVQGGPALGKALIEHPDIDGFFFTGSAKTGMILQEALSKRPGKILALEMGGNNPLVISKTEHIEAAVRNTIQSAYLSAGQRCTCARRLIVIENQPFIELLQKRISEITAGIYTDSPEPFMGPVINEASAARLLQAQEQLEKHGGKVLVRMKKLKNNLPLLSPAFIDVTNIKERSDEEYFGPFLQLIRVANFDEAITEANATRYGLIAGLIGDSRQEYDVFWNRVKTGLINWNSPLTGASSKAPFGGIKLSGNFRPSAYFAADYCSYPVASMEADAFPKKT